MSAQRIGADELLCKGDCKRAGWVTVLGGKTGTTGEAGYCLILLNENVAGHRTSPL